MDRKIEIHKILGLSIEQADNIGDELLDVFGKNRSLREVVDFVNEHYDSKSVLAGAMLSIIRTEIIYDETKQGFKK